MVPCYGEVQLLAVLAVLQILKLSNTQATGHSITMADRVMFVA